MASNLGKFGRKFFINVNTLSIYSKSGLSTFGARNNMSRSKLLLSASGVLVAAATGVCYCLNESVKAADLVLHPPKYPWPNSKWYAGYDHASLRRGWEVYKQVCAACHSLNFVAYREMVDVFLTLDEAKAEAAEAQIEDGPDASGKMFLRPGRLSDYLPPPYPNEEAARAANNGALPPDLSLITLAREGSTDYIFSLLTSYCDPPAGINIEENQHFNPYFTGGAIGMAQALYDDLIEYSDGTPASASQLAKDVTHFLEWCAEPELEDRIKIYIKATIVTGFVTLALWYYKRHVFAPIMFRKIIYKDIPKK